MRTNRSCRILGLVAAAAALSAGTRADEPSSQEILAASGVKGGLVVHLGCGDGKLTAGLRAGGGFVVHGLDRDEANVSRAREHVRSLGIYGPVSIALLEGNRLPYADDLVTLVVAGDLGGIAMDEVTRVLRPLGTAYVREGGRWNKTVKPWPDDIGEWSHFLGDASNNAVAKDTRAGPPRRLKWTAGPPWCRSHEFISSFCAMVTAGARVYYVMDLGQPGVTNRMSERWTLFARDAFNGVLLWQKPLPEWRGDEWKGTSMRGRPPSIPRRIVAGRDRLYATLSHKAGVSVIDPDTGKILREIPGTEGTQEIALAEGALVLRLAGSGEDDAALAAFDAQSGARRWQVPEKQYRGQSMAAAQGLVAYDTGRETVCLDLADGKELWRSGNDGKQAGKKGSSEQTLIVHDGLVLDNEGSRIVAREARTGKVRWDVKTGGGAMRPYDFFVIGGLAWHADSGGIAGYDLKTGKTEKTIDPTSVHSRGHHLRCYGSKATERYLITPFRGTEFVSLAGDGHSQNDWTRGPCRYGVMPANGMLYVPPHQCFCYPGSMMHGLNAYGMPRTGICGRSGAVRRRAASGAARPSPTFPRRSRARPTGRCTATTPAGPASGRAESRPKSARPGRSNWARPSPRRSSPAAACTSPRRTATPSMPSRPLTARRSGVSPRTAPSTRHPRPTGDASSSEAPTDGSTASAPRTAPWRGASAPRPRNAWSWTKAGWSPRGGSTAASWSTTASPTARPAAPASSTAVSFSTASSRRRARSCTRGASTPSWPPGRTPRKSRSTRPFTSRASGRTSSWPKAAGSS